MEADCFVPRNDAKSRLMILFNRKYFGFALLLFITEVLIALFVRDNFFRPYGGDVLVVILLYCFLKSFLRLPVFTVATGVLAFSFIIEFLQYIDIVARLGLENSVLASTVIGTSFAWLDVLAYVVGVLIVLIVEKWLCEKLRVV